METESPPVAAAPAEPLEVALATIQADVADVERLFSAVFPEVAQ